LFRLCFALWRSGPARVAGNAVTLCWGRHGSRGIGSCAAVLCRMKTACIGAGDTIERRTAGNAYQRKANRHEPERRTCNQRTNLPIIVRHCDSVGMNTQLSWLRSAYDPAARLALVGIRCSNCRNYGVVQIRVTPKTRNPFTIRLLLGSGVLTGRGVAGGSDELLM